MKLRFKPTHRGDVSLIDLLAIIAAVAIVAGVFVIPMVAKPQFRSKQINCVNNLKQVGFAFRLWSYDNGDKFPSQVSTNLGGAKEFVAAGGTFRQFLVMSNELTTPKILLCPSDSTRTYVTNFNALRETNVSYFVVPEADETLPAVWLSGDRNLALGGQALRPGLTWLSTNATVSWTAAIHGNKGNICLTDCSVQQLSNARLQQSATDALAVFAASNNAPFRLLIP
jgi:hypothetical protein